MKFSKPQFMGALGVIEQTYYEMGSAQSQPCFYKSSDVTDIGWIQTLFLWILKSLDFGISTISSDSQ